MRTPTVMQMRLHRTVRGRIGRIGRIIAALLAAVTFSRCGGESTSPDPIAQVTLTPTALTFTGGAIANPRITPITTTAQGMTCQ